ncbi:MAG: hypothetical protein JEZ10_00270 [Verrucomicrobia bacterium]|nr:hypothetical protein [Verrucomicrobiota bacterium]
MSNEWTFEADLAGLTLSQAENVGSEGSVFSSGGAGFLETDGLGGLLCINDAVGVNGMWTNGAVLDAGVASRTSGICYLRYDIEYSLTNALNDSGAIFGAYFTDSSNGKVAGLVLNYDTGGDAAPTNYTVTVAAEDEIAQSGTLTAIAAVDLDSNTLKVWYSLTGSDEFDVSTPSFSTNITLGAIDNLRFHATGDFRPLGSSDFARMDNLRTASTWADILIPTPDFSTGPMLEIVSVTVTNPSGMASTEIGETNTVAVVIRNLNAPATNVISFVSAVAHPEYFTIVSNSSPETLSYPEYLTNTFFLVANTNAQTGTHDFNVEVTADGGVYTNTTFPLTVGSSIIYLTNSVAEVSGGVVSGRYEPNEVVDITVFSTNNGANDVSNIVNSLSANLSYFSISNLTSSLYPFMAVGDATSTTYRVTIDPNTPAGTHWFSVTNQAGSRVWADTFSMDIFVDALPAITPAVVNLSAVEGQSDATTVTVTNSGNAPVSFTITDDAVWDVVYAVETGDNRFAGAATPITLNGDSPATKGVSSAIDLGFNFPLYGITYSKFYVTSDGVIGLGNTTNTPALGDSYGALPDGDDNPLIAPFWSMLSSPEGSIRYTASEERVVISYLGVDKLTYGGTNLSFQAILYADGRVEFRYKNINGDRLDRVTVGIQGDADHYENLSITPASGTSVLIMPVPVRWVSYAPASNVSVGPQQSVEVTFIADATDRSAGDSNSFTATFNWSTGTSDAVAVSATVTAAMPAYSAVSSLSFTGAAGQVTSAPFVITNTGTGPLTFTISDDSALTATMIVVTNAVYDWVDISAIGHPADLIKPGVNPFVTAADEGYSEMIPIGFAFPFFGTSYSEFCIGVNGALRLDTTGRIFDVRDIASDKLPAILPDQLIAPYGGDLFIDGNATLKYHSTAERLVVTWENMGQYGYEAGSNLTFQVILEPTGRITCQYKFLEGHSWPKTVVGGLRNVVRDVVGSGAGSGVLFAGSGDIRQAGDWTINTNYPTSSTSYTQYVDSVSERVIAVQPDEVQVITYSPNSGSVPVGGTAEITLTGNASGLALGGNTISADTQLNIVHNGTPGTNTLDVTFTVTNSQQTVFSAAPTDDSDGDGVADDDERIAGTDPQDAASAFTPEVTRTANGALLSWEAPLDGSQRTYKIYWTADLMSGWNLLATVTDGTAYLDAAHSKEPVVYYKVTAE